MQPSKYQEQILDWLQNGKGHGCCNAVAGSGKSTTLKLGAIALQSTGLKPNQIKIIVFGKANANDLIDKFGWEWKESISTLHSAGWTLIKDSLGINRAKINAHKYKTIAQQFGFISDRRSEKGSLLREKAIEKEGDFIKLIDLVRCTNSGATSEEIEDIADHFEIELYEPAIVASAIGMVLQKGEESAERGEEFDFTDQIWLPVKWNLSPKKPYKVVLVDECQDLNAAQLELSLRLAGKRGRMLFVGDRRQAIMGFAGADCNSYQNILDRTKAKELPLSICYRCPSSHIDLVKRIFPDIPIEVSTSAKEGAIAQCDDTELSKLLQVGDLVISRKTAPLVKQCIRLISQGIKATVKGRDIGKTIVKELEAIAKLPGFKYADLNEFAREYRLNLFTKYKGLDNEEQLRETLSDKLEAIQVIYTSRQDAQSIADLSTYIEELFSDDTSPITLSTCHRAKGLENDRIFLLNAKDMPMKWRGQKPWQLEQEMNLLYVALTRSKSELFIVGDPDWLKEAAEEKEAIAV